MNKHLKQIFKIVLVLFIIFILFLAISFIVHKAKYKQEYDTLDSQGYINKYSAGDYDLNIYQTGNENSEYTIVGISGLGVNNYSVEMKYAIEELDYHFVFIDRAGYGYSDDTKITQTTEQIVNDYRNALKSAGIEGPYILMPHSLGGVYATYWESTYPEEIQGLIMIDTSELCMDGFVDEEYNVSTFDYLQLYASKLGLGRMVLHNYYYKLPDIYSTEDNKITDSLNIKSLVTYAKLSEEKEINHNANFAYENMVTNQIPKVYICSSTGFTTIEEFKEYNTWVAKRQEELGLPSTELPDDDTLEEILLEYSKWREEKINPYIEKLGNTKFVLLPGDHYIFEQKPEELRDTIKAFVDDLE